MKIGNIDIKKAYFGNKELSNTNAFLGTVSVIDEAPEPQTDGLCFTAIEDTTISLKQYGSSKPSGADDPFAEETGDTNTELFQTSTDGLHWNTYTIGDAITLSTGDKLYWKGNVDTMATSILVYKYFTTSGKVNVSGNIMSLLGTDTLSSYAFAYLFNGTKIVNTNELSLPATTLAENCYRYMFNNCLSLVNAPELPATTLAGYCYRSMFQGCVALVNAPELPATTLRQQSYNSMFFGCTSLVNAPELPATTLASYCYNAMFNGCTSLVNAPELPATTLASNCYTSMFNGCTSLVNAPALPAVTLESSCYKNMFYNCSALNKITTCATSWDTTAASNWVYGVAATGDFYNLGQATIPTDENGIPEGWVEHTEIEDLCFTALEATTISMVQTGTDSRTYDLSTSKNGVKWTSYTLGTNITLAAGEKLYWKGNNTSMSPSTSVYKNFTTSGKVDVSGNIMSILGTDTLAHTAFNCLFMSTKIVNANELLLPATTLAAYCYKSMFYGCVYLINAPELPATTLFDSCYRTMFAGCTSLATAPELPATTCRAGCYEGMFQSCTSLVNAPELPATTLATYCYYVMFNNCTALVNAPELPATTLANYCYYGMFYGCTSLVNAPALPATTLRPYCYQQMFQSCTSLVNAPSLPATTLANYCYYNMFYGCTSLVNAPALPAVKCTPNCYLQMFANCTSLVNAPEIAATNLSYATSCFMNMFYGCTSLVSSPVLYFSPTYTSCAKQMFYGCTSLKKIITYATSWNTSYAADWVNGVATTGDFYNLGQATIPTGVNGIPTGWVEHTEIEPETDGLCFTALEDTTIDMSLPYDVEYDLSTSTDGVNWEPYTSLQSITLSAGDKLYWKGNNTSMSTGPRQGAHFSTSGKVNVSGNIMSLLGTDTLSDYAFERLFTGTKIVDASELLLPATELAPYCYSDMFSHCEYLTAVPELPATTLADYCYGYMFYECTALENAPELPATELADYCYYQMFYGCTALSSAIYLPAKNAAQSCYNEMLYGCSSINNITMLSTTSFSNCGYTIKAFVGVAETGTFTKVAGLNMVTISQSGYMCTGYPDGWNLVNLGPLVDTESLTVTCDAQTARIHVSDTGNWTITPSESWLDSNITGGSGDTYATLYISANEDTEPRTGYYTITDQYCSVYLIVNQRKYVPVGEWIEIEPESPISGQYIWNGDAGLVKVEFSADDMSLKFNDAIGNTIELTAWGVYATGIEYEDEGDNVYICTFNETWECIKWGSSVSSKVYWKSN